MDVRDGRSEIDAVGEFFGLGAAAAERLCADRRVEVAIEEDEPVGAVAYDFVGPSAADGEEPRNAAEGTVHVTRLAGTKDAQVRLLDAPLRFARNEGAPAEMVVPEDEGDSQSALRAAGFEQDGSGPRFEGKHTVRYRHTPTEE